jgi:hypothetical protein
MPNKQQPSVNIEGHYGDVSFSLVGPNDTLNAIVKFIKNLTRMSNGGRY